jgi:membrane protein
VPIFIFWLFVSWSILLFGARLVYVVQNASALLAGLPRPGARAGREILAGQLMLHVARAFDRGDPPPDGAEAASQLGAPPDDVDDVLTLLRNAGLVVSVADGGLVPSRPLEKITLEDVRRAMLGEELPAGRGVVASVLRSVEEEAASRLAAVTLRQLCDGDRGAGTSPAPSPMSAAAAGRP